MSSGDKWLLPEGIEEVLPPHAAELDRLCRQLLDLFHTWGYELVLPPLVEYLDSLLTGSGEDLELQTFKMVDQLNGKMLGIRADTTPQVVRIDVNKLQQDKPTRLCYLGPVLHTVPVEQGGSRAPMQMGAELYGHAGFESDVEVLSLMLQTLHSAGLQDLHVDMNHVGLLQGLINNLKLKPEQEAEVFDCLERKAASELETLFHNWNTDKAHAGVLLKLIQLTGDFEVLDEIEKLLQGSGDVVLQCLAELIRTAVGVRERVRNAPLFFDLTELQGYHYYTGLVFVAYAPGESQGVAFGGRYDGIGAAFGHPRPATGFSTDARRLFDLSPHSYTAEPGIFAPASDVPGLHEVIDELRGQGEVVICELPGQTGDKREMGCDRELVLTRGRWKVQRI
ncbi:MAG: ATP phosphoribosyltransferase regulatory subunit [Gammaproteobacteria bacterium]